jgi:hypothetical protein
MVTIFFILKRASMRFERLPSRYKSVIVFYPSRNNPADIIIVRKEKSATGSIQGAVNG